jgi:hypothetical protein
LPAGGGGVIPKLAEAAQGLRVQRMERYEMNRISLSGVAWVSPNKYGAWDWTQKIVMREQTTEYGPSLYAHTKDMKIWLNSASRRFDGLTSWTRAK